MVTIVVNSTIADGALERFLTDFPLEILIEIYQMYIILSLVNQ